MSEASPWKYIHAMILVGGTYPGQLQVAQSRGPGIRCQGGKKSSEQVGHLGSKFDIHQGVQ